MTDLAAELRALGEELDWPQTPELAAPVLRRVRPRRRPVLVVAVALLVPAGAVAAWLGPEHVELRRAPGPPPRSAATPAPRELGARVTVAQAARRAGFAPVLPRTLGAPRAVRERDGVVTLLYPGLRLSEVDGSFGGAVLRKTVSGRVRRVPGGVFIHGRHFYAYLDAAGSVVEHRTRVAGRTLIVERAGLVLRLEGAGRERALRLLAR